MPYLLTTQPTGEALTKAEVKLHLRLNDADTSEDALLDRLITVARRQCEKITRRSVLSQGWRYVFDSFPGKQWPCGSGDVPWGETFSLPDNALLLEKGPITAISSIKYLDMSGVERTLAPSVYVSDLSGLLARVAPGFGQVWEPSLPQIGACQVNFTAGYTDAAAVPVELKQWMLLRIGVMYEHREEWKEGDEVKPMPFVDCLLDGHKIVVA